MSRIKFIAALLVVYVAFNAFAGASVAKVVNAQQNQAQQRLAMIEAMQQ